MTVILADQKFLAVIPMVIGGVIMAAIVALLLGFVVLWLWNWLMPDIFGLTRITFWQAWGLVVLAHILFKSFPHHDYHNHDEHWKDKFHKKFFTKESDADESEGEQTISNS
ncbi:MAG TPA: hypothetical protein ENH29_06735 [Bacteroidetes bacterium]|nr:hypothetical protein [Bacteroidota bacterium]